jgi:FkbM family methyltransferase
VENYSQNEEQRYILEACEHVTNRRWLDVGACHFKTLSNTRALYELGWSGVMVEAAPAMMAGLVRDLGTDERIELVNAAMATEKRLATLYVTDDILSTTVKEWREERDAAAKWLGRMRIQTVTFADISNWFEGFEFVNIDTEGTSVDLAFAMLDTGWRPQCCCIENDGRMNELCSKFTQTGYKLVYASGENGVFSK